MSTTPPGLPSAPPQGTYVKLPKSSILAVVLSFLFPGVGQIYVGQPAKAFVFFFAFVGSIYAVTQGNVFPFAFLIPFIYFFGLIDAYRSAEEVNARYLGTGSDERGARAESPWWGAGLVVLGLFLLLSTLGWIDIAKLGQFWPLILIVLGGLFLYSSLRKRGDGGESGSPNA